MRQAGAWFFLTLIVLSWLGSCRLCLDVTYQVRLLHRMNAREAAIAHQLEEQLRQDYVVRVVGHGGENLRGVVYSVDFLFSVGGVHYMLVDRNRVTSVEKIATPAESNRNEDANYVLLKDYFQTYIINNPILYCSAPAVERDLNDFRSRAYFAPARSLPKPPPDPRIG